MNQLRPIVLLAALGLAVSAAAQPAPRSFSSYFFFGDSLTDNGNTFFYTGQPPAPYFNGRFSNGPTYAEYLRSGLTAVTAAPSSQRTNINFAFAGATAVGATPVPASLGVQLALYQGRAITATANDLFVVLAGANDLLNALGVPANQNATAMSATGVAASTAVVTNVQALANLGAKRILVLNLPDIHRTPRFTTGSAAAGALFMQSGVVAFNNDLRNRLGSATFAADVGVTLFDLNAIFNTILLNPQRFGFSITNQEYVGILLAGGNPGDVNNYVFWDGIHPTTRTHALFATVLGEVLNPEFVLGTAAVQGTALLTATDMTADSLASRLDLIRAGGKRDGAHGFVSYSYKDGSRDYTSYQNEFSYTGSVITAGFDAHVTDNIIAGIAASKDSLEAKLRAGAGSFKLEGQTVSVYAQWKSGSFFADAAAGFGSHDIRSIARTTVLGGMRTAGETEGDRWTGQARVGFEFAMDTLHVTPFAGLRYTKADLAGYSETGVNGLNFAFDGQTAKSVDAVFGATADWQITTGDNPVFLGLSAMFQKDVADDVREFSGRLADTVSARTRIGVQDGLEERIKLGARLGGAISKSWGWSVGYLAEIRDDGDTASQYSLSIQTGF